MKLLKPLQELVFRVARQKGSHIILVKDDIALPVPKHKEIKRGLLVEIISEAWLTKEEFLELTKK